MSENPLSSLRNLKPVERRPASEMVAERLLELIYAGNIKAGDILPTEQELGAALHVSRPVVREALRGLQLMGVVESRQGGRCSVTDLKPSRLAGSLQFLIGVDEGNVEQLFDARIVIEGQLLLLGAPLKTDDAVAHLDYMVGEGYRLVNDPVAFRVMDLDFHQTLYGLAGNAFLSRVAQSFYHIGSEFRRIASETAGVLEQSAREHEKICAAVKSADGKQAAAAMQVHLESIRQTTKRAMQQRATV